MNVNMFFVIAGVIHIIISSIFIVYGIRKFVKLKKE